ncbi:uncharacterized protein LOC134831738 [Culicoides brevitarsis]|uniref:uncharacterized protein LOC134831738 n=1 Tax=Culicoides brevitarsis TaxID=469753 RepID=UPI00307C1D87
MGAYLSEPITEKISSEGENEEFSFGASSMQGWRVSQEDAHNAILDFDTNTSFWAVYDGHGGAEVSAYCAQKLPAFLKKLDSYKAADFEKALKDAFIGFDLTLLEQTVIEELKQLAKKNPDVGAEDSECEDEDENIADLYSEARMPLREVLEKYKDKPGMSDAIARLQQNEAAKPLSPCLKGPRSSGSGGAGPSSSNSAGGSSSSSSSGHKNVNGGSSSSQAGGSSSSSSSSSAAQVVNDDNDATVSSSSSGKCEEVARDLASENPNVPDSSSSNNATTAAPKSTESVSTSSAKATKEVVSATDAVTNGEVVSSGVAGKSEGVSSSSSGACENGEVSSNTNNEVKNLDSSTDDSDEDALEEENSDTENGDEEADLEEIESEEDEDMLTEEDEEFMNNMADEPGKDSGCTAVVALIRGNDLYVANAGDSRCVICRAGETIEMSLDHKPEDQIEFDRIKKAGGRVTVDGRVNGGLNLSRAIGDHGYKTNKDLPPEEQMISALPDVRKLTLTPQDEFMVLACDGIWNFMTSEDVVRFVRTKLAENPQIKLTKICEELFDFCLAPNTMGDGTGCDNMTAIIVKFNKNVPVESGGASTTTTKRAADEVAVPDDSPSTAPSASKRAKVDEESELSSSNSVTTAADQAPIIDTSSSTSS